MIHIVLKNPHIEKCRPPKNVKINFNVYFVLYVHSDKNGILFSEPIYFAVITAVHKDLVLPGIPFYTENIFLSKTLGLSLV